ncbi:hypothetical protein D3C87_1659850 [compost metagenome]
MTRPIRQRAPESRRVNDQFKPGDPRRYAGTYGGYLPDPPPARPWSLAAFRQVRRADLRTGYAGPKASPIARLRAAFFNWCRRGAASRTDN